MLLFFARTESCVLPFVPDFNHIFCFAISQHQYTSIKHETEITKFTAKRKHDFIYEISFYSSEFGESSCYKCIVEINEISRILFGCFRKCINRIFCHNIRASENEIGIVFIKIYTFRHKPLGLKIFVGTLRCIT